MINIPKRWNKLYESIKQNYLLTICSVVHILAMSVLYPSNLKVGVIGNMLFGIITYSISCIVGYYVHVYVHSVNFEEAYKSSIIKTYLAKPIKWIVEPIIYILDFHDKIHHNTRINKLWYNIAIETISNLFVEGIGLIILLKLINFGINLCGHTFKFNYPILFAWSITYATVHNINYNIITPICHIQHHINKKTNYGSDFMDIIFNSKYDNKPEEMNHISLNVILTMLLIMYIKDYIKPNKENLISSYLYNIINWFITN